MKEIILISDILNLPPGKTDYDDRVQKRWDYIQKQLELNPDWVGYDYAEYWHGRVRLLLEFKNTYISTKGEIFTSLSIDNKKIQRVYESGYPVVSLSNNKIKDRSCFTHRVLASTFIPRNKQLKKIPFFKLQVNHKNGIKKENSLTNLEWCTAKQNVNHAYSNGLMNGLSGLKNPRIIPLLATVITPGPYKGKKFVLVGKGEFIKHGFHQGGAHRCYNKTLETSNGCTWKGISQEDIERYDRSPPSGYLEYYNQNKTLFNPNVLPVLGKIVLGENAGYEFCLVGKRETKTAGFTDSHVRECAHTNGIHKGVRWSVLAVEDVSKYPRGLTKEIFETIK